MGDHQIAIVSTSKRVKLAEVQAIADACNRQAAEHVCPSWRVPYRPINVYDDPTRLPLLTTDICTLHDEPGTLDVLGYHSLGLTPFAKVYANPVLDAGGTVFGDPNDLMRPSLAAVFSHELSIELTVDPGCDQYAIDGAGREVDLEPGDPFQRQQYVVFANMAWGTELLVLSDFALPAWFKVGSKGPYNWMSDALPGKGPFEISPGGYAMVNGDPVFARRANGATAFPESWWLASHPPGRRRMLRATNGPLVRRLWGEPHASNPRT